MEHFSSAFYLTILGLACIAAAPLFLFQKHESVFCAAPLLLLLGLSILIIGLAGLKGVSLWEPSLKALKEKWEMNWLLLSTIGCSLFVLFTSSGTEKSSIRKTLLGIFLFPSASFCLMLKGRYPAGFTKHWKLTTLPSSLFFSTEASLWQVFTLVSISVLRGTGLQEDGISFLFWWPWLLSFFPFF